MALQDYLNTLAKARSTGIQGNFARANTRIPANMQNGVPVYEKQYRDQTMYAPEIFSDAHFQDSLNKAKERGAAMKLNTQTGGINFDAANGSFGANNLNSTPTKVNAASDLANTFGNTSTGNTSTTTNVNTANTPVPLPSTQVQTQDTNPYMNELDKRISSMQDAINARYNSMMDTARQVSSMNQSNIKGNLGRIFGSNADTSESAPVVAENKSLGNKLYDIGTAKNEALANLDMSVFDKLQAEQARQQQASSTQRQQDFNNALALANLTGSLNGAPTLEAQNSALQRALQEAGVTGVYNGSQTLEAKNNALQNALQEAGVTGLYNGNPTVNALNTFSSLTGYFNGQPTMQRETLNTNSQQKQINDILDYIASTQNNLNTNQTKMSLADVNNAASLQRLLESLNSKESIASMNNSTKMDIANMSNNTRLKQIDINQQKADAYSTRLAQLANKTDSNSISQAQALNALIQMRRTNSQSMANYQNPQFDEDTISLLEQAAGLTQKKN